MVTFTSSDVTSVPAPTLHAGVNARVLSYTLNETASGSTNINMAALPAGARIVNMFLAIGNNALGIVAAPGDVRVQDSLGNVYITSASANKLFHTYNPTYASQGIRVTSSCNLQLVCYPVASGTASTQFKMIVEYIKMEDGD